MILAEEREKIVIYGQKLLTSGLTKGTGGNISIFNREKGLVAISPSGLDYFEVTAEDVVVIDLEGQVVEGKRKPSSEHSMHSIFYQKRSDVTAVVHTHSPFSTTLATLGWELPPTVYLIAVAGRNVRCAEYATFGTQELAVNAFNACQDRQACFLANHGLLALGSSVEQAFSVAENIEHCAEIHYRSKCVGEPRELTNIQLDEMLEKIGGYGQ